MGLSAFNVALVTEIGPMTLHLGIEVHQNDVAVSQHCKTMMYCILFINDTLNTEYRDSDTLKDSRFISQLHGSLCEATLIKSHV